MFLVYNKETTLVMRKSTYADPHYKSEAAAKAFLTRMTKLGYNREEYAVADARDFYDNIEQTRQVRNLITGKMVTESANTPNCCSVASETYWSM